MMKRKTLLPILIFLITLALGGTAVFVAQKIKGPKVTEEPPKKFAKAPDQPVSPTTPTETEAATPTNICSSTGCECTFTATGAPTGPSCTLLSISPTGGLANQEFTANVVCKSGTTAFDVVYLMTRKQGTTAKVRLTLNTVCTGSGDCTQSFKFTPSGTSRGLPALTEAGIYDLWITARSVGPDGIGGNDDDLACTDIPDNLRDATTPAACGQKGKTFTINPSTTHKACQSNACAAVSGAGTDQCQTNADCQGNQKPSCGRLEATPTSGTAPVKVTFTTNGASDPDGTLATYEFDFGDESGTTISSNSTSHTYQTAGSFEARVWVRDNLSLRSDMTDFCKVKITVGSAGAPATTPTPTTPTPTPTPQPTSPTSTTTPAASPSAAPTGSREMTVVALLGGLVAILLGGWWYARLDPAWQKFEKGLTRFWERK